jgi:methylenetetrahydrofolate reductase (NADPH)
VSSACPKQMLYGPCADLSNSGACEVSASAGGPGQCVFLSGAILRWPEASAVSATSQPVRSGPTLVAPLVLTELPDFVNSGVEIGRLARGLAGHVDAVLFGDTNWARVKFPPSYRAAIVEGEGLRAWPGLNARDRNRVALEGELAAMADLGVLGVHCVTGNHPVSGNRPDAAPVFDLDSTRLAALAASMGLTVSVAASPHTPPVEMRALRSADKARAGAQFCMIDQPSATGEVSKFIADVALADAPELRYIVVVNVVLSHDDFARWNRYPNARIPSPWRAKFAAMATRGAASHEVATTGRELALDLALSFCELDRVDGVLFGATADPTRADDVVSAFQEVSTEFRQRWPSP